MKIYLNYENIFKFVKVMHKVLYFISETMYYNVFLLHLYECVYFRSISCL